MYSLVVKDWKVSRAAGSRQPIVAPDRERPALELLLCAIESEDDELPPQERA